MKVGSASSIPSDNTADATAAGNTNKINFSLLWHFELYFHTGKNNNNDEFANRILTSLVTPGSKKKKFLSMANFNEEYFMKVCNKVIAHVLRHFEESAMAISVFD